MYECILLNIDVSAGFLKFLLFDIAQYPAVQEKVLAEVSKAEQFTNETLPYCNTVMNESGRMHPMLLFTMYETTTSPKEIGGFMIPPNVFWEILTTTD